MRQTCLPSTGKLEQIRHGVFIRLIKTEILHLQILTLRLNNYMHFLFNCQSNNPALKESEEEGEGKKSLAPNPDAVKIT